MIPDLNRRRESGSFAAGPVGWRQGLAETVRHSREPTIRGGLGCAAAQVPKGQSPEDAGRAVRLYERGLTIKEVVAQVGYSFSTIRRMLHANGVAVRERGIGKRIAPDERSSL